MITIDGKWRDQNGDIITITGSSLFVTLKYSNGRGPFSGLQLDMGTPVLCVDFNDRPQPEGGPQAGLLNFEGDTITWSNETVWKKA